MPAPTTIHYLQDIVWLFQLKRVVFLTIIKKKSDSPHTVVVGTNVVDSDVVAQMTTIVGLSAACLSARVQRNAANPKVRMIF
jgi:hypothetical protein